MGGLTGSLQGGLTGSLIPASAIPASRFADSRNVYNHSCSQPKHPPPSPKAWVPQPLCLALASSAAVLAGLLRPLRSCGRGAAAFRLGQRPWWEGPPLRGERYCTAAACPLLHPKNLADPLYPVPAASCPAGLSPATAMACRRATIAALLLGMLVVACLTG